jgi:hypothetical protein
MAVLASAIVAKFASPAPLPRSFVEVGVPYAETRASNSGGVNSTGRLPIQTLHLKPVSFEGNWEVAVS